jgi:hypothetical protein
MPITTRSIVEEPAVLDQKQKGESDSISPKVKSRHQIELGSKGETPPPYKLGERKLTLPANL